MRRLLALALLACAMPAAGGAQTTRIAALTPGELHEWDARIAQMLGSGELRVRWVREDTLIPGRVHQRLAQHHQGVPVFGGELVRQTNGIETLSLFGTLYEGIGLDPRPGLTPERARELIEALAGAKVGPTHKPELVVLPREAGGYALAYCLRVFSQKGLIIYFIDARSGELLKSLSDLKTDVAVGLGTGVLGDRKKVSADSQSGTFTANDRLRPPAILTYDMKGDLFRVLDFLNGFIDLDDSDLARDSDNDWTDGANVDGHTYAGWVYDYYFKRHGRRGLDDNNIPLRSVVHPVRRDDIFIYPDWIIGTFFLNAFYLGNGIMVYGEGLPEGLTTSNGQSWNYLAGGLDIVAHELSHGVTDFSSQLIYENEPGALNEAFSDIMGTSVEFFFQQPGGGPLKADYLLGEDVITPGGIRSMADPGLYGDPDHYSRRYLGSGDNGGVHTNSGIANQAFYLAIEGGTNHTSGLSVTGVGPSNREQIEKVFYRAFTSMLPASGNFSAARAATIQSARELYGSGSSAERAVTQAWTAVGVS